MTRRVYQKHAVVNRFYKQTRRVQVIVQPSQDVSAPRQSVSTLTSDRTEEIIVKSVWHIELFLHSPLIPYSLSLL